MNESKHSAPLVRAANRASERTEYLGWVFRRYAELEKTTVSEVAGALGVSTIDYHHLRLCLRPRAEVFAVDVQQIATRFAANVAELAKIVRHVEALTAMREEPATVALPDAGWLMAARARKKGKRRGGNHGDDKKS